MDKSRLDSGHEEKDEACCEMTGGSIREPAHQEVSGRSGSDDICE
jgi:hypothetical protein